MLKISEIRKMTDGERTSDVYELIRNITNPELLRRIADLARREISDKANQVRWKVGQFVQLLPTHRSTAPWGAVGKVFKVNPVKLAVDFDGRRWNVPKSMLQIVE